MKPLLIASLLFHTFLSHLNGQDLTKKSCLINYLHIYDYRPEVKFSGIPFYEIYLKEFDIEKFNKLKTNEFERESIKSETIAKISSEVQNLDINNQYITVRKSYIYEYDFQKKGFPIIHPDNESSFLFNGQPIYQYFLNFTAFPMFLSVDEINAKKFAESHTSTFSNGKAVRTIYYKIFYTVSQLNTQNIISHVGMGIQTSRADFGLQISKIEIWDDKNCSNIKLGTLTPTSQGSVIIYFSNSWLTPFFDLAFYDVGDLWAAIPVENGNFKGSVMLHTQSDNRIVGFATYSSFNPLILDGETIIKEGTSYHYKKYASGELICHQKIEKRGSEWEDVTAYSTTALNICKLSSDYIISQFENKTGLVSPNNTGLNSNQNTEPNKQDHINNGSSTQTNITKYMVKFSSTDKLNSQILLSYNYGSEKTTPLYSDKEIKMQIIGYIEKSKRLKTYDENDTLTDKGYTLLINIKIYTDDNGTAAYPYQGVAEIKASLRSSKNEVISDYYKKIETSSINRHQTEKSAATAIIEKFDKTIYEAIYKLFPINAQISEILERDNKGYAKLVKIDAGENMGVYRNCEFKIIDDFANPSKGESKKQLIVESVSTDGTAICKVLDYSEEITEILETGKSISIISVAEE